MTTLAQTVFDIAHRLDIAQLERVIDDPLLTGRLRTTDLDERLAAYGQTRRPGLPLLRAMTYERGAEGWTPPDRELEARLWPLVLAVPGMPGAFRQPSLPWRSTGTGRCDILIPDWLTIIEGDGRRWHARVEAFDADRWRDNEAAANGYRTLRFTWVHITHRPTEVINLIERVGTRARQAA